MGNFLGCKCEEKGDTPLFEIKKKRSCTDVPLLALFVALWVLVFALLGTAVEKGGDPQRLIRGVDWNDAVCGVGDMEDRPLAAWPKIPLTTALFNIRVCVSSCDATNNISPTDTFNVFQYTPLQPTGYASEAFLGYCMPVGVDGAAIAIAGFDSQKAAMAIGDVYTTADLIGYSALVAVVLAFVYIWFVRHFAGMIVWSTVLLVVAGGAGVGTALFQEGNNTLHNPDPNTAKTLSYAAYAVFGATFLFLVVIVALRKRIQIAVEVIKEASKSLGDMPGMVAFPLLPFVVSLGYVAFWVVGLLYIFSVTIRSEAPLAEYDADIAGKPGAPTTLVLRVWDDSMQNALFVHVFHLLWNLQFFLYAGYMVIAGCVAQWYYTPYDAGGKKPRGNASQQLPRSAVAASAYRTVRYHLGTVAFGSLIIAVVNMIRLVVKYMESQSKARNNRIRKAIFCLLQCCLKCLKCCLDKLSKNAFVYSAIYGDPFCTSAWTSFAILWRNLARVAAINMVGTYISFLGKMLVAFGSSGIAVQVMTQVEPYKSEVSSPFLTAAIVLLLAYVIAAIFMVVYETAVDTIFLCFLIDEEQNKNGVMLASKSLLDIINRYTIKGEEKVSPVADTPK